ncbi:MAG TPA: hypothetical protein VFB82_12675 [Blastocatellia bacterium]|nr:hypothetical protein [Blastocatellia bacterium]
MKRLIQSNKRVSVRLEASRGHFRLSFFPAVIVFVFLVVPHNGLSRTGTLANSWRGITPLRSSASDVARIIGVDEEQNTAPSSGPYQVEGGEVTFSYLTPTLAKIYRAPASMTGKVFTIYFKPSYPMNRSDLILGAGFRRCTEDRDRSYYYFVNDSGVAYRFNRGADTLETMIYQPSRAEVRRLAVSTECVF